MDLIEYGELSRPQRIFRHSQILVGTLCVAAVKTIFCGNISETEYLRQTTPEVNNPSRKLKGMFGVEMTEKILLRTWCPDPKVF